MGHVEVTLRIRGGYATLIAPEEAEALPIKVVSKLVRPSSENLPWSGTPRQGQPENLLCFEPRIKHRNEERRDGTRILKNMLLHGRTSSSLPLRSSVVQGSALPLESAGKIIAEQRRRGVMPPWSTPFDQVVCSLRTPASCRVRK